MQCRGKNNPKWKKYPAWSKRDDYNCYYCPEALEQAKKGSKIISRTREIPNDPTSPVERLKIKLIKLLIIKFFKCGISDFNYISTSI